MAKREVIGAARRSMTAGLAGLALGGCVALPIPLGEGRLAEGREISPEQSATIDPGGTSRAALLASLGEPQAVWEERRILVYAWDRVHWQVLVVLAGYLTAAATVVDVPTHYLLLVALDDRGIVRRAERCVRPPTEQFGSFLRAWADGRHCA